MLFRRKKKVPSIHLMLFTNSYYFYEIDGPLISRRYKYKSFFKSKLNRNGSKGFFSLCHFIDLNHDHSDIYIYTDKGNIYSFINIMSKSDLKNLLLNMDYEINNKKEVEGGFYL